jgi:23S rRNA (cytosine1962-C5)-methyltransferase
MIKVFLKQGREEAPARGHPWVFSGAIERVEGEVDAGGLVDLFTHAKGFIGRGYYNPHSQIAFRLLTRQPVAIDKDFFRQRIQTALALRKSILSSKTTACRLIHAEGDLLPGLICDRYGDYLVMQINTAGMERFRDEIIFLLKDLVDTRMIYDRSDAATRSQEGLSDSTGPIVRDGTFPGLVEIRENNMKFLVDVKGGQKTGFYLDQRDNRALIRGLAQGKRVLNCFAYTGGFSVSASLGGVAAVTSVEASAEALELCKENLMLNNIPLDGQRLIKADVFQFLRDDQEEYDLIILDPPAFAKRKGQVKGAIRGYKDINLYAMKRLKKGGQMLTCSCSQHIDAALFPKILAYAATDAACHVQVLGSWGAPQDHPVALHHPEGAYLKALLLRVVE